MLCPAPELGNNSVHLKIMPIIRQRAWFWYQWLWLTRLTTGKLDACQAIFVLLFICSSFAEVVGNKCGGACGLDKKQPRSASLLWPQTGPTATLWPRSDTILCPQGPKCPSRHWSYAAAKYNKYKYMWNELTETKVCEEECKSQYITPHVSIQRDGDVHLSLIMPKVCPLSSVQCPCVQGCIMSIFLHRSFLSN